jgi:hypothetical protein
MATDWMRALRGGRIDAACTRLPEPPRKMRWCVPPVPATTIAVGMPGCVCHPRAVRARNNETALVVARDEASPSLRQLVRLTAGAADDRRRAA